MSNESGTGVYVYQQIVKTTAEWEADKTVPVENVWLFERRDDGKIITKLSDGQHCYSDLPTYGLSAGGSNGRLQGHRKGVLRIARHVRRKDKESRKPCGVDVRQIC